MGVGRRSKGNRGKRKRPPQGRGKPFARIHGNKEHLGYFWWICSHPDHKRKGWLVMGKKHQTQEAARYYLMRHIREAHKLKLKVEPYLTKA